MGNAHHELDKDDRDYTYSIIGYISAIQDAPTLFMGILALRDRMNIIFGSDYSFSVQYINQQMCIVADKYLGMNSNYKFATKLLIIDRLGSMIRNTIGRFSRPVTIGILAKAVHGAPEWKEDEANLFTAAFEGTGLTFNPRQLSGMDGSMGNINGPVHSEFTLHNIVDWMASYPIRYRQIQHAYQHLAVKLGDAKFPMYSSEYAISDFLLGPAAGELSHLDINYPNGECKNPQCRLVSESMHMIDIRNIIEIDRILEIRDEVIPYIDEFMAGHHELVLLTLEYVTDGDEVGERDMLTNHPFHSVREMSDTRESWKVIGWDNINLTENDRLDIVAMTSRDCYLVVQWSRSVLDTIIDKDVDMIMSDVIDSIRGMDWAVVPVPGHMLILNEYMKTVLTEISFRVRFTNYYPLQQIRLDVYFLQTVDGRVKRLIPVESTHCRLFTNKGEPVCGDGAVGDMLEWVGHVHGRQYPKRHQAFP